MEKVNHQMLQKKKEKTYFFVTTHKVTIMVNSDIFLVRKKTVIVNPEEPFKFSFVSEDCTNILYSNLFFLGHIL